MRRGEREKREGKSFKITQLNSFLDNLLLNCKIYFTRNIFYTSVKRSILLFITSYDTRIECITFKLCMHIPHNEDILHFSL